jgi:uncharacterized protein YndB with AHSA1/START domain
MPANADRRRSDVATRVIDASHDTIYQAFASAASLMQWLPPAGMSGRALEYEFREGGRYRIELRYDAKAAGAAGKTTGRTDITHGRFLELQRGRRITQSVEFESSDPAFADVMTMTWAFDPAPQGTTVTVRADNVPDGISKSDHDAGLRSSLRNLAVFVEGR